MKMKIPTPTNPLGNGYYYGDRDNFVDTNSDNGSPANSNSADECDSPTADGDFSEYLWMENEEQFDREFLSKLEEEELIEECLEAMRDEEMNNTEPNWQNNENHENCSELCGQLSTLQVVDAPSTTGGSTGNVGSSVSGTDAGAITGKKADKDELAKASKLNPLAAEFVPSGQNPESPPPDKVSS